MTTIADRLWAFKRKATEAREFALSRYSAGTLEWAQEFDKALAEFPDPDAVGEYIAALEDALSGLHYIRMRYGDLDGVGWSRVDQSLNAAREKMETAKLLEKP